MDAKKLNAVKNVLFSKNPFEEFLQRESELEGCHFVLFDTAGKNYYHSNLKNIKFNDYMIFGIADYLKTFLINSETVKSPVNILRTVQCVNLDSNISSYIERLF